MSYFLALNLNLPDLCLLVVRITGVSRQRLTWGAFFSKKFLSYYTCGNSTNKIMPMIIILCDEGKRVHL
jgi:hypothetical protein